MRGLTLVQRESRAHSNAVNMSAVFSILDEIRELALTLDGADADPDMSRDMRGDRKEDERARARRAAQQGRDLLYAAHLADLARVELASQWHRFKGQDPPVLEV